MSENILLFHIGMHKTGTTALQRFLYENTEILKKYGWCYPRLRSAKYDTWKNGCTLMWPDERGDGEWKIIEDTLKDYNVVISNEGYCIYRDELYEALAKAREFHDNIKVIIYLRRQDRAAESLYNQLVKGISEHGTMTDFINHRMLWTNNYYEILDELGDKFGKENVIVRVYEKDQFKGSRNDIFSDFMCAISDNDLDINWDEFMIPDTQNFSLDNRILEIKKLCNSVINNHDQPWNRWVRKEIEKINNVCCSHSAAGLKAGYFTKEERSSLLESQKLNNARIAKEFLNRDDGVLFYDDFLDYPVYEKEATDFEEAMIRILFGMIYLQQCRLEVTPAATAVSLLRKGRKLAFYGMGERGERLLNYPLAPDLIIDNDPAKADTSIRGVPVIPANKVDDWKKYFVVITPIYTAGIEKSLCNEGLEKGVDYILLNDFFDYFSSYYE